MIVPIAIIVLRYLVLEIEIVATKKTLIYSCLKNNLITLLFYSFILKFNIINHTIDNYN